MEIKNLDNSILNVMEVNQTDKIVISKKDFLSLQKKAIKFDISENVNTFLFEQSVEKCLVEDKDGNIIYPFNAEHLKRIKDVLACKEDGSNEIRYRKNPDEKYQLYEYSEQFRDIMIQGETEQYLFKCIKNISKERDYLTGLDSREVFVKKFENYLKDTLGRRGKFAYFFMDMDEFKSINDTYGHEAGDEVLRSFGKFLKSSIRSDDIAARFGGDEFIMILKNITPEEAYQKGQIICEQFKNKSIILNGKNIDFGHSLSVGIHYIDTSLYSRNDIDNISGVKDQIRVSADKNVYRSKKAGKNIVTMTSNEDMNDKKRI